mmetsp:Transcript_19974/g.43713  ORF Transcript_19974/g.43713 Transcript_19974/m.43713 type:complete len:400 (-) Transcript_19974:588-1787(-)
MNIRSADILVLKGIVSQLRSDPSLYSYPELSFFREYVDEMAAERSAQLKRASHNGESPFSGPTAASASDWSGVEVQNLRAQHLVNALSSGDVETAKGMDKLDARTLGRWLANTVLGLPIWEGAEVLTCARFIRAHSTGGERVIKLFRAFNSFRQNTRDKGDDRLLMTSTDFIRMVRDLQLLNESLTPVIIDIVFSKCVSRGHHGVDFEEFMGLLVVISEFNQGSTHGELATQVVNLAAQQAALKPKTPDSLADLAKYTASAPSSRRSSESAWAPNTWVTHGVTGWPLDHTSTVRSFDRASVSPKPGVDPRSSSSEAIATAKPRVDRPLKSENLEFFRQQALKAAARLYGSAQQPACTGSTKAYALTRGSKAYALEWRIIQMQEEALAKAMQQEVLAVAK